MRLNGGEATIRTDHDVETLHLWVAGHDLHKDGMGTFAPTPPHFGDGGCQLENSTREATLAVPVAWVEADRARVDGHLVHEALLRKLVDETAA